MYGLNIDLIMIFTPILNSYYPMKGYIFVFVFSSLIIFSKGANALP